MFQFDAIDRFASGLIKVGVFLSHSFDRLVSFYFVRPLRARLSWAELQLTGFRTGNKLTSSILGKPLGWCWWRCLLGFLLFLFFRGVYLSISPNNSLVSFAPLAHWWRGDSIFLFLSDSCRSRPVFREDCVPGSWRHQADYSDFGRILSVGDGKSVQYWIKFYLISLLHYVAFKPPWFFTTTIEWQ